VIRAGNKRESTRTNIFSERTKNKDVTPGNPKRGAVVSEKPRGGTRQGHSTKMEEIFSSS
jgi:hypothetical protein